MNVYEVWAEGYAVTGNTDRAHYYGTVRADSFAAACRALLGANRDFDETRLTVWGCRLFDNETAARKAFG